jgi:cell division protein FtsL
MTRQSTNKQPDTVTFERQTWRWIIGLLLTVILSVGSASLAVVKAAYQVAADVQEMRLAVESRVTKIETLIEMLQADTDRRLGRLEARQDGGTP